MIISGEINEMIELFNSTLSVRFYQQIDINLFEIELRSTVPNRIKTIKQLYKYLSQGSN